MLSVAAANHADRRSAYSDYGPELALCSPSSDLDRARGVIGGIYATDRRGAEGYNAHADYTDSFGGTSAAAPQVAAVLALMLSVNPELDHATLRSILEQTAAQIDPAHPSWKERDGRRHSDLYGYGRIDAARAVAAAAARLRPKRARSAPGVTKRLLSRPRAALRR